MCMFSFDRRVHTKAHPVRVASTRIFARGLDGGREALAYSMSYESPVDVAMVLPLPTPAAPAADAVQFVDLSGYHRLFDDLQAGFPELPGEEQLLVLSAGKSARAPAPKLKVYDVGSFEASFVPTAADFVRLDARFRLPEDVLDRLPIYRDYSFAVFKLKPGSNTVHPMAFTFPRRNPSQLFFPTVHAHDGTVPDEARFDHALYGQFDGKLPYAWETSFQWQTYEEGVEEWVRVQRRKRGSEITPSEIKLAKRMYDGLLPMEANASGFVDAQAAKGLVRHDAPVHRIRLHGMRRNQDVVLDAANDLTPP